jgi:hypothetical protein
MPPGGLLAAGRRGAALPVRASVINPPRLKCMTESCIATCRRLPLPVRARSNSALTIERHQDAGAGVADRRARLDRLTVALAGDAHRPARAWAIGSNDRPFSYGLPSPKPLTWA